MVGLVLGGGGARGFFHIGVIEALRELEINITSIAGTSVGGLIGAIYASDPNIDFNILLNEIKFLKLVKLSLFSTGILSTTEIKHLINKYVKVKTFDELKIKLKINATDIRTGKEVIFDRGLLETAILASIAVPGILPLIEYKNYLLADGGIINNVPLHLLGEKDLVLSDLDPPLRKIEGWKSKTAILRNAFLIMQRKLAVQNYEKLKKKKNIVSLQLSSELSVVDFRKSSAKKLMEKGYQKVMKDKVKIKKLGS